MLSKYNIRNNQEYQIRFQEESNKYKNQITV